MTMSHLTDQQLSANEQGALATDEVFVFPLSFAQQRLWFLDQLEPGSASYNLPRAVRLKGALNVAALEQSLNEVVRRHEALRTTFTVIDGEPAQLVHPAQSQTLPVTDLRELAAAERGERVRQYTSDEARRPFNLSHGPLLRAGLLRLADDEYVLFFTLSHIISDGWSLGVLIREVATLYRAFSLGLPSPLSPLQIQYADYAAWQREWLTGAALAEQLDYWTRRLAGAPPVLALPTDNPRPAALTGRGGRHLLTLSAELTQSLRELSRRSDATLFMTLLAAFNTLLYRYTGQADIVVGTPVAGRNRPETEELIGFFVNTLALRTDLSGDPTFIELLQRVRTGTIDALAHQDLPFEMLVERLQPERALSHTPLFQVMFALQNTPRATSQLPGLSLTSLETENAASKFDLTLDAVESRRGLQIFLRYSADLFEVATIERLAGHFQTLLAAIAADPERRLSTFNLLTAQERDQLLCQWSGARRDYPLGRRIHQLVEAQTERAPGSIAVAYEDERLSYQELNAQANRVAQALLQRGLSRGCYVPVLMDRSLSLVPTLLGVMKTGAAFVPLDINWPASRLCQALDDLGCGVVLINHTTPQSSAELGRQFINVEELTAGGHINNPQIEISSADPIYVIYTSGSTGKPKGVVIPVRGITNRFLWMDEFFGAEAANAVLQTTRHVFDSAVWQFFWPLINGGKTVLPSANMELTAEYLTWLIAAHEITITDFVPSVFNLIVPQLLDGDELKTRLRTLRCVIIGGEEITPGTTYRFMERFPAVRVFNLYGPTEASIGCICHEVRAALQSEQRNFKIPIGKPIANTHALVLDQHRRLVPVGAPGELYLSGVCLGLGYLNDKAETQAAFVDNPFAEIGWPKMYKTGDLARYLADGNLEFLGRRDQQIKLRGFRIELAEIEAALAQHPLVRQVAVLLRQDSAGEQRLVAYLALRDGAAPSPGQWRQYLKERLPEYMVPSAYVALERLPLTASGKVDRRSLPATELAGETQEGVKEEARTATEEIVAGVWSEVLGLEKVGRDEDFFDLGGHSLLATRVISRLRQALQIELPLRALFERPTVASLAASIDGMLAKSHSIAAPPLRPMARNERVPLSFAQQRLWFLDQLLPGASAYNIPAAVRLKGELNVDALERGLSEVIRRHEALRTTFAVVDNEPVQIIAAAEPFKLPLADLSESPPGDRDAELQRLAAEVARRSFDLSRGPLLRACLVRLGKQEHALLLTMHHSIGDGWSTGVLTREAAHFYSAFTTGQSSPLAELPIQYADYAVWQREWLQGEALEEQLSYWKRQLSGAAPKLSLLTDHPRSAVSSARASHQSSTLSPELTKELKRFSRKHDATLFMTLLAAFKTLLYRYTGQEDISVGVPIANRNRLETEQLIGLLVNTLVMRTRLSADQSFSALLRHVREVALGAYAHQDLPFEKLVEALQPERDLSHTPLFQVMFNLLNFTDERIELPGLTLEALPPAEPDAKFDLILYAAERGERIHLTLLYNASLFEPETIDRMLNHLDRLLDAIAHNAEQPLYQLPILTESEEHQLLAQWNDTARDHALDQRLCQLFEAQVARAPHSIALIYEDQQMTYGELNRHANQLAHHLRAIGVGPEVCVGVCLDHSIELVIALLAILKAGGAYVPLDPRYPAGRLTFMLADTHAPALLTTRPLAENLPTAGRRVINLDSDEELINREPTHDPVSSVQADNLAYVIYTSGSTGQPKGVMISHRAILNHLLWRQASRCVTEADRFLQKASISFDISVWEMLGTLLAGAQLVIAKTKGQADTDYLVGLMAKQGVTVAHFGPAMLNVLLDEPKLQDCHGLRRVYCGGEALTAELQDRFFAQLNAELYHQYGPTETSVDVAMWTCQRGGHRYSLPIGRPIDNSRFYVLDRHMRPVPIGVAGELHIAGSSLGRGYLNQPELTAEKFIPNPFSQEPGALLYRTGDLARYLVDGNLEFLGRRDQQIKLRGFRIELAEIEAALAQHPLVRQVAVLLRQDSAGEQRLVAYLALRDGAAPSPGQWRQHLKERLPEYMVPSAYVALEGLPLTVSGKVDRRSLPAPELAGETQEGAKEEARTPTEEIVAGVWSEVLGLEKVGRDEDFFNLGGHSLLITRLIFRLRELFQIELPVRCFFAAPTVAGLAQTIEVIRRAGPSAALAAIPITNLNDEIALDPSINAQAAMTERIDDPPSILLTGATGFLGGFLLHELLRETRADVYCLVRAEGVEDGKRRLQHHLARYELWDEPFDARIIPVIGDLSQPLLGLSAERFATLASAVDRIYHNGALVNFTYPYYRLKASNVLGTQEILRLASQVKLKPLHYISTLSVFSSTASYRRSVIGEHDDLGDGESLPGGYSQSKWVAESLVELARERGMPIAIYRPGRVTGHSATGIWNTNDFACRWLKGCVQLGSLPTMTAPISLTPVDYVSRAIIHLSRQPESLGKNFHLVNDHDLAPDELIRSLFSLGYKIEQLPYDEWREKLVKDLKRPEQNALQPFIPLFATRMSERPGAQEGAPVAQVNRPKFNCHNTLRGLAVTSIRCPAANAELLRTYTSYFVRIGFLPAP